VHSAESAIVKERRPNGVTTLWVKGRLDARTAPLHVAQGTDVLNSDHRLVVDFSRVTFLSSSGSARCLS